MNTFANMNTFPTIASDRDGVDSLALDFAASRLPMIGRTQGGAMPVGVALAFASDETDLCGEDRFALLLVDSEGHTLMQIGPFGDDDVVAVWRDCAARTGLPRMIVREDGSLATISRQLGRVALGLTRTRRRHGLLNGRRPRFLVRRKTGTLPVRPLIHRGENEIVAGAVS